MWDLYLLEALQKVKSEKVKTRIDGVKLVHSLIIGDELASRGDDTTYFKILSTLFISVGIERLLYARTQKAAIDRLNALGLVVRAAITTGCQKLRKKSIRHFLSNVIPAPGEDILLPLRPHYLKALRVLLSFPPHLEQMSKEQVVALLDYCQYAISSHIKQYAVDEEFSVQKIPNEQSHMKSLDLQNIMACFDTIIKSYSNRLDIFPIEYTRQLTFIIFDYIRNYEADVVGMIHAMSALTCIAEYFTLNDISSAGGICADFLTLLCNMWSTRSVMLRCHLAALFLALHPLIPLLQRDNEHTTKLPEILQLLFESIFDNYISSINVERLQLEHIAFDSRSVEGEVFPVLKFPSFELHSVKAELPWSTVFIMSYLTIQLEFSHHSPQSPSSDGRPAKRLKSLTNLQKLIDTITVHSVSITALQVLSFAFQMDSRLVERLELKSFLLMLWPLFDHEDSAVQCWTMFCIASLISSTKPELLTPMSPSWMKLWRVTLRKSCLSSTCRFSCHLLRELLRSHVVDISELMQSILMTLEMDQIGSPAVICDSSLRYWELLFGVREYLGGELSSNLHQFFLKWLNDKWIPYDSIGFYTDHSTFLNILTNFCGFEITQSSIPRLSLKDIIGKTCQRLNHRSTTLQYLIKGQGAPITLEEVNQPLYLRIHNVPPLIQLFSNKLSQMIKLWEETVKTPSIEQIQYWSIRSFEIVAFSCAVICRKEHQEAAFNLLYKAATFTTILFNCLATSATSKPYLLTESFSPTLDLYLKVLKLEPSSSPVSLQMEKQFELFFSGSQNHVEPLVDVDFESRSDSNEDLLVCQELRNYTSYLSVTKWNYSVIESIRYQYAQIQRSSTFDIHEYMHKLSRIELLCAKLPFIDITDFSTIMKAFAKVFLEDRNDQYLYGLCDIVVVSFIELVTASVSVWTLPLDEKIDKILHFFLKQTLSGTTSSISRIKTVDLLLHILKRFPDFTISFDQSVRSLVIQLFNTSDIDVFAFIVRDTARFFGCFDYQDHCSLFGDIIKTLNMNSKNNDERIQLRAEFLLTVIRISDQIYQTAVYHLFELAAFAEDTVRRAFDTLATSVGLTFTQLFEEQYVSVFHWWLRVHGNIDSFPYRLLGFSKFEEFVTVWGHQIYCQLLMLKRTDEANEFIKKGSLDARAMFSEAFVTLVAHSSLSGIKFPHPAIKLAKSTFGELTFRHKLAQSMPDIICVMIRCTRMDDAVEILGRRCSESGSKLAFIMALGDSKNLVQIPSYSLDVTLDALENLLLASDVQVWSPASLIYMCRQLLTEAFHQIHPSLSSVILKQIRLLVVMADTCFWGYAYNMVLRGVALFIENPVASADAIGLLRYMLSDNCPGFKNEPDAVAEAMFTIYQLKSLKSPHIVSWFLQILDGCRERVEFRDYASILRILHDKVATNKPPDSDAWKSIIAFLNLCPTKTITNRIKLELLQVLSTDFLTPTQMLDKLVQCVRYDVLDKLFQMVNSNVHSSLSLRYMGIKYLDNPGGEELLCCQSDLPGDKYTKILQLVHLRIESSTQIAPMAEKALRVFYRDALVKQALFDLPFLGKADEPSTEVKVYLSRLESVLTLDYPPQDILNWTRFVVSYFVLNLFNKEQAAAFIDLVLVDSSLATDALPYLLQFYLLQASTRDKSFIVHWFDSILNWENCTKHQSALLECLLHLRVNTIWLPIDLVSASKAALRCHSFNLAAALLESERAQKGILPLEAIEILHDTFALLSDPDLFYARKTPINLSTLRDKFIHESRHLNQFQIEASQLEASVKPNFYRLQSTLSALGYSAVSSKLDSDPDLLYENAWKLEQWDIPIPRREDSMIKMIYKVFHTLAKNNSLAPGAIDNSFRFMSKEYKTWLAILVDCERYAYIKDIISSRRVLLSTLTKSTLLQNGLQVNLEEARVWLGRWVSSTIDASLKFNQHESALTNFAYLDGIPHVSCFLKKFKLANILWEQKLGPQAVFLLEELTGIDDKELNILGLSKSKIYVLISRWSVEARLMQTGAVYEMIENAIDQLKDDPHLGELFYTFAEICSSQYEQQEFNDEIKHAKELFLTKEAEVLQLKTSYLENPDDTGFKKRYYQANKMRNSDFEEYTRLSQRSQKYYETAIQMYLECLKVSDEFDDCIFRLCALWLSRYDQPNSCSKFGQVASHKFIRIFNQLSSRLDTHSGQTLVELLTRIVVEHPFHTIYTIFAIQNMTCSSDVTYVDKSRSQAAKTLLHNFSKVNSFTASLRCRVERLVKCYVDLGVVKPNTPKLQENRHRILFKDLVHWRFPNPTSKIPISVAKDYSQIPTIQSIDPNIKVASGNSKPLVLKVLDSSGIWHRQIVKHGDDLRQDSVMEQVFDEVDNVLRRRRETRHRSLSIRTYIVIPLYPRGGLIQWVDNTTALKDYLNSRHHKYYKHDFKYTKCHELMSNVQGTQRIKVFKYILENFHPTMNRLFLEDYPHPDVWFAMRVRFARSLAVGSIVGEVIGLGDRHGLNILFDHQTGEIINIDLGIAFEKVPNIRSLGLIWGKMLPVPEMVPFRLTQNLVDGLGYQGVEGTFRRCCEITLCVLREEKKSIMTILDVLKHDPLYDCPLKLAQLQTGQIVHPQVKSTNTNYPEAERALFTVAKKLTSALGVEATVNELIQTAGNVEILAMMYQGWGAWQ